MILIVLLLFMLYVLVGLVVVIYRINEMNELREEKYLEEILNKSWAVILFYPYFIFNNLFGERIRKIGTEILKWGRL